MVNRTDTNIANEINKLNETEAKAVVNYISQLLRTRLSQPIENNPTDDLIISLSDDYENKRARQVFEWERVRRQNVQRAA